MYTELRAHSAFSFNDGAVTPEVLVHRAAELGYRSIGLTDTADFGGGVRFVLAARDRKIKPIVGAELVVDGHPLALLVRDAPGYRNLAALVTEARVGDLHTWQREQPHTSRGLPGLTWSQVAARSGGLHLLTGPPSGRLATLLQQGRRDDAARTLAEWREAFGARLAVEVQRHQVGSHELELADRLIELAEQSQVPWVVANDPRYIDQQSRMVHDMFTALRAGRTLDQAQADGLLLPNGRWRLLPPEEMARLWADCPAGLAESDRIAEQCDFNLAWMRPPLPKFEVPDGHDDDAYLRERVELGARDRWGEIQPDQRAQIEHELDVIRRLGFAGFFLVMWDAIRWARSKDILYQGRGSAANSVVAYCLGITAVDPVKHNLLFERFLSDVRVGGQAEAPDIDVDVEHDRREELLDYVYDKYRRPSAAITCTVQHYRAPNALLDAMRALGYPADLAQRLAKRIHRYDAAEGADYVRETLAPMFHLKVDDARGRAMLTLMAGCDGLPRLRSTHVGGFVLASAPLGAYLPVEHTTMGRTIVQFDKDDLDAIGVPKYDFLGLGGLSLIRRAFDAIARRTGRRPELYQVPYDDAATYAMISRGETIGTFQIESRAQIASIVKTQPEFLYDIVVQVALIRPGPVEAKFVQPYTQRRRGREPVTYPHPKLEPILKRTQGLPIFQEQAMAIAMTLGGYGTADADALRRTMGHNRKRERLLMELDKLRLRLVANEVPSDVAARIAQDLQAFGSYGFPESHAWSFALIAFATAWLKCHYPAEFYMGLLNSWPMGFYAPSTLMHEAKRQGVAIRPPCLRDGDWECTVEETGPDMAPALRIGWRHVRGVGERMLERLKLARNGGFDSIDAVVRRAKLSRSEAMSLAQAGAFGAWEPDRRRATWQALRAAGDVLPLAPARRDAEHRPPALERNELIYLDYHTTGMSLEGHPMERVRPRLRRAGALDSRDLSRYPAGTEVLVAGLVTIRQQPETANGVIFLLLEDEHGFINVIVPSTLVEPNIEAVKFAPFVAVLGRFDPEGPVLNVVGRRFRELIVQPLAHKSRDFH